MKKKNNSGVQLNPKRDVMLLIFLWKWKLATTATLTAKFFPGVALCTSYRRLWTLAKAELHEDGFKSEHVGHDLAVAASIWAIG